MVCQLECCVSANICCMLVLSDDLRSTNLALTQYIQKVACTYCKLSPGTPRQILCFVCILDVFIHFHPSLHRYEYE